MPSAEDVSPQKWSEIEILLDDGSYSVIFGKFEGNWILEKDGMALKTDMDILIKLISHFGM